MLYFFSSQMFPLLSFSSIALSAKIYNDLLSVFTFFTAIFLLVPQKYSDYNSKESTGLFFRMLGNSKGIVRRRSPKQVL